MAAPDTVLSLTDVGLVDLYVAAELIPPRPHHGSSELVQPGPSGLVTPQPKGTPQAKATHTMLLVRYEPNRFKPHT